MKYRELEGGGGPPGPGSDSQTYLGSGHDVRSSRLGQAAMAA